MHEHEVVMAEASGPLRSLNLLTHAKGLFKAHDVKKAEHAVSTDLMAKEIWVVVPFHC